VVLLDVKMPGKDGIQVLKEIKKNYAAGGSHHAHRPRQHVEAAISGMALGPSTT
jgi:CheY-like chemotaxis protein